MENLKPHELCSRYFDSRFELRQNLAAETSLIERISELPEDDHCHHARETMQLGAGYAVYLQRQPSIDYVTDMHHVFFAYFATQPQNRYLSDEVRDDQRLIIIESAMKLLDGVQLEPHEDPYSAAALAAFIEGYSIVMESTDQLPYDVSACSATA